jgi:hypothetical protein
MPAMVTSVQDSIGGSNAFQKTLFVLFPLTYLIAAVLFTVTFVFLRRDVARAHEYTNRLLFKLRSMRSLMNVEEGAEGVTEPLLPREEILTAGSHRFVTVVDTTTEGTTKPVRKGSQVPSAPGSPRTRSRHNSAVPSDESDPLLGQPRN